MPTPTPKFATDERLNTPSQICEVFPERVRGPAGRQLFCACVRGLQARSLWALLRPLPGKPFPNGWDFCIEACVLQDRDRFVFGDFVVVIAALLDGLDECGELLLVDHGLFFMQASATLRFSVAVADAYAVK